MYTIQSAVVHPLTILIVKPFSPSVYDYCASKQFNYLIHHSKSHYKNVKCIVKLIFFFFEKHF